MKCKRYRALAVPRPSEGRSSNGRAQFQCQETVMKALVYQGPGKKVLEERPKPEVAAPTDAIVKIVKDDDLRDGSSHS